MYFPIGIFLLILSISVHELGHAFAMKRHGIKIQEISIFGFGPVLFRFYLRKWFGETPIVICAIPLGAYVSPSDYSSKRVLLLPYKSQCEIYGAGIAANFLFGGILLALAYYIEGVANMSQLAIMAVFLIAGLLPKYSCHLILPIGLSILGLLVYEVLKAPSVLINDNGSIISIVGVIKKYCTTPVETLKLAAKLSAIALGLTNTLPFFPLDGGRILSLTAGSFFPSQDRKFVWKVIGIVTAIPLVILLVLAIMGDITRII